jgi:hypothetical protein
LLDRGIKADNIFQVNFEDPFFISGRDDPHLLESLYSEFFTMKNPGGKIYLFFDEIHNVHNWQYWIRDLYDRNSQVKMFLTGSNAELLSTDLATHLTGRVLAFENFPFSFCEYLKGLEREQLPAIAEGADAEKLFELLYPYKDKIAYYIERSFESGMFPELVSIDDRALAHDILAQYFQNVLFRDIVPRFSIRNTKVIEQLAYNLSTNFTSLYSYRRLAEAVGSNDNTIKEYVSYFEKAYLFFSIDYFEYSLKRQFKRNRKIYALDCGLRQATSFSFSHDIGKHAENTVFLSLRQKTDRIYYWYADSSNKEIDFVVMSRNQQVAINVTYTDDISQREFDAFNAFAKVANPARNILVTKNIFETRQICGRTIELIPLWLFVFLDLFGAGGKA